MRRPTKRDFETKAPADVEDGVVVTMANPTYSQYTVGLARGYSAGKDIAYQDRPRCVAMAAHEEMVEKYGGGAS